MPNSEELYDKNGRLICKGDLLRTFHFMGARRKKYFLYHVAVLKDGVFSAVPTSHLEPTLANGGGRCLLRFLMPNTEIIAGSGPGDCLCYDERPKNQRAEKE